MKVSEVYDNFINDKELQGLSDSSLKDYYFCLKGFISHVGNGIELETMDFSVVTSYIQSLLHSRLSRATVATYIRNVRIFLTYASKCAPLLFDPKEIKVPKSPKKKIEVYSDEEIKSIFWAVDGAEPWIVARNRAIIALMLDSGVRQNEVCTLKLRNVSFEDHRMKVHGKGDKERYVPLFNLSSHYLSEYMRLCPYDITDNIFLSFDGGSLSGNAIRLFISKLQAKLPFRLSSHKLRHNFATNFCLNQMDAYGRVDHLSLQLLMGHESLTTTYGYIHCAMELLAVKSSISHLDKISGLP